MLNFLKKCSCKFYEEGNAFNTFVRPQGYTQSVLVINTKHIKVNIYMFVYKKAPLGPFKGF